MVDLCVRSSPLSDDSRSDSDSYGYMQLQAIYRGGPVDYPNCGMTSRAKRNIGSWSYATRGTYTIT
jgi:hypothetical protein